MPRPKYWTTSKDVRECADGVGRLLDRYGALHRRVNYSGGSPVSVEFVLESEHGRIPFSLAPKVDGVRRRMDEEGILGRSKAADPEAVAWRQLQHFVELQLEIVESGLFTVEEVFAGSVMLQDGATVGQKIGQAARGALPGEGVRLALPPGAD